ncbi:unnamed protein product [Kuraishia capsulata CBS 1993]|uniref:Uncharacterized protein n=1 Tax=Kuraishia capsulata CBS 1993 TaxID=1382522 RepID=W6MHV8_9ASCO|nr:uncharacterized protein KUCA_T00001905001 [Kuraishia capsulata CBS 1993]CDK25934.1 unnamed protein product [Kuraishia capsulata CBS 1993]
MTDPHMLPPIDDFRLSSILNHLEDDNAESDKGAVLRHVVNSIVKVDQNYVNDIAFELERLFLKVELEDIIKQRMDRLRSSIQKNDKFLTMQLQELKQTRTSSFNSYLFPNMSHSSLGSHTLGNHSADDLGHDAFDPQTDVLDLKELHELTLESKKRFQRITMKMKTIESNLPRRDRLFVTNSPHRHHYPRLAKFGLQEEASPREDHLAGEASSGAASHEEPLADPVEPISDIKLNQYIQLEQELSELERQSKTPPSRRTHPMGLATLGISPIRKDSVNPTSLLLGINHMTQKSNVELNSETVLVKDLSANEVTNNDNYIDDLKKYIHN